MGSVVRVIFTAVLQSVTLFSVETRNSDALRMRNVQL